MFALTVKSMKRSGHDAGLHADTSVTAFILPRSLRRVVRFFACLATGRIHIPAHTGTVSLVAFYGLTAFHAMSLGGHTEAVSQATTSAAGFAIENVEVSGNAETSEIEILQLLGLDGTTSLVALNIDAARQKIAQLPWVEKVEVRKIYPKTIDIRLSERKAYAIWQHGTELSLVEQDGRVIAPLRDNKFSNLPLVVGQDAEKAVDNLQADFSAWPDIKTRVKAYVRIAGRRWDLHLENGVIVKLPEDNIETALTTLDRLEKEQNLLARDIAAVDLRLDDRTTVQLTPEAMLRRQTALDARTKILKKTEQNI